MKLLSVDPSSKATGWALFEKGQVTRMGIVKSSKKDYWDRIVIMGEKMLEIVSSHQPDRIVIECSSVGVAQKLSGRGRGLAHYGEAVGAVCAWLVAWGHEITRIPSDEWTKSYRSLGNKRRQATKKERQELMVIEHKEYRPANDSGADVSDAIAMGAWFLRQQHAERIVQ